MDKKDEIILQQLEVIRTMTERNLRSMGDDFWGTPFEGVLSPKSPSAPPSGGKPVGSADGKMPAQPSDGKTAGGQPAAKAEKTEVVEPLPKEDMKDLQAELDSYIGLATVKEEVRSLINMASVYKLRRQHDLPTTDMSLHMVFTGNPGTGKTMMARMMARIYRSLDILSKGQLVEVDRSGLVAGYVGQTAIKTQKVIQKALGGVLFIDEAYSLTSQEGANDFGKEAIEILLKNMEDHRDDLIVIVAGYTNLMEQFIHSNPGLESRFNKYFYFEDYTAEQLYSILESMCRRNSYVLSEQAGRKARTLLEEAYETRDANFGNARDVRNLFEDLIARQADRVAAMETPTKEDLMLIQEADFDAADETSSEAPEPGTDTPAPPEAATPGEAAPAEEEHPPQS